MHALRWLPCILTIMVMARAIRMYRMVATDRDPRMAIGRSRLGFFACMEQHTPHDGARSPSPPCADLPFHYI